MSKLRFRRYLGHDCNSWDGLNNGQYIDDKPIDAKDYDDAIRLCVEALEANYNFPKGEYEDISHGDGPCIQIIIGYSDKYGNDITEDRFYELVNQNENAAGYTYVYVSAEYENED